MNQRQIPGRHPAIRCDPIVTVVGGARVRSAQPVLASERARDLIISMHQSRRQRN